MIKAKEVCLANHLGLLIIPQSKLVTVSGKTFIVEKFLDLNPIEWAQESLYITYANQMEEAIRQLSILIAKTGFSDVTWRNIPILNEEPGYEGPRRIGLIDLEGLGSSLDGFIGFFMNGSRGLINCLASERLIDIVIEEARNHGVLISNEQAQSAKKICRARLEFDEGLKKFYKEKKIEVGNELIEIDESLLDFSEYADEKKYKANSANNLKNTAIALIKEINCQIKESSPKNSVEGRRRILVNISSQELPWFTLQNQYLEKDTNEYTYSDSKVFVNNTCLGRAVNKLVELGAIYKLTQFSERGYYLQA